MPEKSKMRKRLLYDLSPIPEIPVNKNVTGKLTPEIRVVYDNKVLLEFVRNKKSFTIGTEVSANCTVDESYIADKAYELIGDAGKNFTLNLQNDFKGSIYRGEEKTDLAEYLKSGNTTVDVDESTLVILEFGPLSICVSKSMPEPFKGGGFFKQFDAALVMIMLVIVKLEHLKLLM